MKISKTREEFASLVRQIDIWPVSQMRRLALIIYWCKEMFYFFDPFNWIANGARPINKRLSL